MQKSLYIPAVICWVVGVIAYVVLASFKQEVPAWLVAAMPALFHFVQMFLNSVVPPTTDGESK